MDHSNDNVFESMQRLNRLMRRNHRGNSGRRRNGAARLLSILNEHDGLSAKELAQMMDIRPPSLSEALDRLEKHGEITRSRDENDSRIQRIALTEQGAREFERRREEYFEMQKEIESCLTDEEKRIFCDICEKLSVHLTEISTQDRGEK